MLALPRMGNILSIHDTLAAYRAYDDRYKQYSGIADFMSTFISTGKFEQVEIVFQ